MDRCLNLRLKEGQDVHYLPNFIYRALTRLELEWDVASKNEQQEPAEALAGAQA